MFLCRFRHGVCVTARGASVINVVVRVWLRKAQLHNRFDMGTDIYRDTEIPDTEKPDIGRTEY